MNLVKTDVNGFYKDTSSGAIINTDEEAYKKFLAARSAAKATRDLVKRVDSIESDLRDIKQLLLQVLNGRD